MSADDLIADLRQRVHHAEESEKMWLARCERAEVYAAERRKALLDAEQRAEKAEAERDRALVALVGTRPLTADEVEALKFARDGVHLRAESAAADVFGPPFVARCRAALAVIDKLIARRP